jgi:hypothetical protein
MSDLAPWEIAENERWKFDGDEASGTNQVAIVSLLSARGATVAVPLETASDSLREDEAAWYSERRTPDGDEEVKIDQQTASELKRIGAYDGYLKYHRQVSRACRHLSAHIRKLNSALFKNCELESLPERYDHVSTELEDNWKKRKTSPEAVKRGIFLATELIKAFPVYRFFLPLREPLRLMDCMNDRLDTSQVSLVLDEINMLPSAPYSEPSFLTMRCVACDRLMSFYLRTGEFEKALDACDCGITLEGGGTDSRNRFRRRKNVLVKMIGRRNEMKNAWSFDYDTQFKRSIAHHDISNTAFR